MSNTRTRPDVLMLILDTHRVDRLSCYGYGRPTTPHIDRFAEDATLFERAIVPAQWTIPSHASLFTGEYPTTHMVTQIHNTLGKEHVTLAELLSRNGYETIGFCNNPLLGLVDNHLDRGFENFHNYGGAMPNPPDITDARPKFGGRTLERGMRLLRRTSNRFATTLAHNPILVRIGTNPLLSALWLRYGNFKGDTVRSLRDVVGHLRTRHNSEDRRPLFTFINLMETHLPYHPPRNFVRKFAPYYRTDRELRHFMRFYNLETYRWMLPLSRPFTEQENRILQDLYDAEVAYQDQVLRHLFKYLNHPEVRDNTIVIITADHGEGLNHHGFMGHSLVAYDDLVRVPLIVRYPRLYPAGKRVSQLVSSRRIFHSILEATGIQPNGHDNGNHVPVDIEGLSLARATENTSLQEDFVYAEAYTPDTLIKLMENYKDLDAIEYYRCRDMRRAAFEDDYKLITVGDRPDELFDVVTDPGEMNNLIDQRAEETTRLNGALEQFVQEAEMRRPANWEASNGLNLDVDQDLVDRLRALGYME